MKVICFCCFFARGGQAFQDHSQVCQSTTQAHALLDVATIDQQTHTIPGVKSDLSQRQGSLHREIKLAHLHHPPAQEWSAIHHHPARLASVTLDEPAHW